MQLQIFTQCTNVTACISALKAVNFPSVLYRDINDPQGVALLTYTENPEDFTTTYRDFLNNPPFSQLIYQYSMLGRTYAIGYETDLPYVLLERPLERVLNPALPWAIWYPLRRKGTFETRSAKEQCAILQEHAKLGIAFSEAGYGQDIRLACHGLDQEDNDFIIGLVGTELMPLSGLIQRMRKTTQTSTYLQTLGPFFIGHVAWQSTDT